MVLSMIIIEVFAYQQLPIIKSVNKLSRAKEHTDNYNF